MMDHHPTTDRSSAMLRGERARILRRFVALDREAALGAMAASVAHSINTPLMQVYSDIAQGRERTRRLQRDARGCVERGEADELLTRLKEVQHAFDQLRADVLEVASSTRNVGVFAQARSKSQTVSHPTNLLQVAIDLAENGIRHRARFSSALCELPALRGSEEQLGHLFFSSLMASMNAVPENGAANHMISVRARVEGERVVVEVEDTGGLRHVPVDDDEALDAFLLERSPTEVALAVCRALMSDLEGELELAPLDRGCRLQLHLRTAAAEASLDASSADAEVEAPPARRGRVLVIDDEPTLLGLVCQVLRLDHEVEGTVDPHEALARVESGERYDVILCDLMMPAMNGVDLFYAIQRFAPHVASRMVFLTAGAFSEKARSFLERGVAPYLEKPIEPDALRAEVSARVAAV